MDEHACIYYFLLTKIFANTSPRNETIDKVQQREPLPPLPQNLNLLYLYTEDAFEVSLVISFSSTTRRLKMVITTLAGILCFLPTSPIASPSLSLPSLENSHTMNIRLLMDEGTAPSSHPQAGSNPTSEQGSPATGTTLTSFNLPIAFVVLFIAIGFVVFSTMCVRRLGTLNTVNMRSGRHHQPTASSSLEPHAGVGLNLLRALPMFTFDTKQQLINACAVCLTQFRPLENIKMIPACGHYFHPRCIDRWLSARCSCPLCRSVTLFLPLPEPSPELRSNHDLSLQR